MTTILGIIILLVILGILVLVHELGHFAAAIIFGVKVKEFGIGFPPRIKAIKRGETEYSINWIPLGGFCSLKGESGEDETDKDSFTSKSLFAKLVILVAGVFMNFVVTILIFTIGFIIGSPQAFTDVSRYQDGNIRDARIQINYIMEDSPAMKAGLDVGDAIDNIDGQKFDTIEQIQAYTRSKVDQTISVEIKRQEQVMKKDIKVEVLSDTKLPGMGVGLIKIATVSYPPHIALVKGVEETGVTIVKIVTYIHDIVKVRVLGLFGAFVGPVGMVQYTAAATKLGFGYLILLASNISLSLALVNFLPLPALDGGRMVFAVVSSISRKITGKPVKPELENIVHTIGFILLIGLMIVITINDVLRFVIH